jgi:outer membrane protein assembly factor BamA
VAVYGLHRGLLESGPKGGDEWNPMSSGQATFGSKFFFTNRDLGDFTIGPDGVDVIEEEVVASTNGLSLWFEYDNTNFPRNPSKGSRQIVKISRDFGWFDSSNTWTNVQISLSKYLDLGSSKLFGQRVLAFNFWTSNTPSWKVDPANSSIVSNRAPPTEGSSLGGYDRLRAYPSGRVNDKAAVHYAAELRLLPQYQPLHDLPVMRYFEIDWWQLVPFIEVGRVAPEYNADLFSKDLKWTAGIGLRLMAFRTPVRLDIATSSEGTSVWAMFGQPFSRQGE